MKDNISLKKGLPRSCEFLLALCGLIVLSPFFIVCALLVRISSPGAIFFRQRRVGLRGRIFTLYKFRTMVDSSSQGLLITAGGDRRITRIGRVLRKTKLDELPEIYNVLRGDMALVGPRPEVIEYVDFTDPAWDKILSVRPGITDTATLKLRNEESYLAMVEDKEKFYKEVIQPFKLQESIEYLEKRSSTSDILILLSTFKVILLPQTAKSANIEKVQLSYIE